MKNINLYITVVLAVLITGCTKDYITNITEMDTLTIKKDTLAVRLDTLNLHIDSITVNLKNAGSLKLQIADNTGVTYANTKIHLFVGNVSSLSSADFGSELDAKVSDASGKIYFRKLAPGTYSLLSDTVKIGFKKYLIARSAQVLANDSTFVILNPLDYVGSINLHVSISGNGADTLKKTTLKVVLVNYKDYNSNYNRQKVISKAIDNQSCNANGDVVFRNIPSNISYAAYVYVNDADSIGGWDYTYSVSKDNVTSGTVYVSMSSLLVKRVNVSLTIDYYSYTTYTNRPVPAANVVLITYQDYSSYSLYYASQSTILSHAIASGKTNSSGLVTFTRIPSEVEYAAYVYYNSTNDAWASYYFIVSSSGSNILTNYVTGSDLGLTKK